MVAPTLTSDHPGLEVLAEVAKVLAAGRPADEGLAGVVGVLRRGLALRRCRLWLRSADGSRFLPIASPEDETQLPGFTSAVAAWVAEGPHRESVAGGTLLRLPLVHEHEALGCFEVIIPEGRHERMAHDVLVVVAQMLAPVLAAHELSQDLASEVALRTRELEAQRNFAAGIIDSLPVGLYVIDRGYRIRAWNRKREAGTQGVSREDALGREVFEVLDRQPRELLKLEFDRVFTTGEIQQMEMDSQATGEARHYRITKIPMRMDGEDISHVITIGEDVTAWRQAQQRLAQSEKLAAVGQLANGGELLTLRQALLSLTPGGDILAHRDDMRNFLAIHPHRNLRDAVMARLAGRLGIHLDRLDLAGREHPVELELEQLARLSVQNFEHLPPQRVLARHALRPRLALAVPGPDAIAPIDDVQAYRKGVDDAGGEVALGFQLPRAEGDLRGEVLRELVRRENGRQHLRHNDQHVVRHPLVAALWNDDLETAKGFMLVDQRKAQQCTARDRFAV